MAQGRGSVVDIEFSKLTKGRIVWAEATDTTGGKPKVRPLVIIRPPEKDDPASIFVVVCASTSKPTDEEKKYAVELPHTSPGGHRYTSLKEQTWAYCHWVRSVKIRNIERCGGILHENQLLQIIKVSREVPPVMRK